MKALVFDRFGAPPEVREVPDPVAPADGVVIEVRATGLCRSDWHGWVGHDADIALPHVPGHELAGVVLEVGADVSRVRLGQRVTVPFVCACGRCPTCLAGAEQVCEDQFQPGFTAWGSFAERVALPRADLNVIELPADLGFVDAAALGCRFATAYRAVTAHGRVRDGDHVAVFGCGGVGLSAVMMAAERGARVVAVDVSRGALERARQLGAACTVDVAGLVSSSDVAAAVRDALGGGAHVTVDALGSADTCRAAILSLRPRGRHVQVGLLAGRDADPPLPMAAVIAGELEILGSHGMAARDYPTMLDDIVNGRLQPAELVTAVLTLDDVAGPDGALARMSTASPVGTQVIVPGA
ncbi:zinc-dependent alcohol dehydrogenase family protein [uncultured Jatrophihabitans sp.]|uniref:zinc-dependent alcohol dehydrogenase family protein n=1 Tax=uncultured Jatrophihabitans sp. TaxID=1610747 RepID=UPI0035CB7DBD